MTTVVDVVVIEIDEMNYYYLSTADCSHAKDNYCLNVGDLLHCLPDKTS